LGAHLPIIDLGLLQALPLETCLFWVHRQGTPRRAADWAIKDKVLGEGQRQSNDRLLILRTKFSFSFGYVCHINLAALRCIAQKRLRHEHHARSGFGTQVPLLKMVGELIRGCFLSRFA
jgi:hypothetical protein